MVDEVMLFLRSTLPLGEPARQVNHKLPVSGQILRRKLVDKLVQDINHRRQSFDQRHGEGPVKGTG